MELLINTYLKQAGKTMFNNTFQIQKASLKEFQFKNFEETESK